MAANGAAPASMPVRVAVGALVVAVLAAAFAVDPGAAAAFDAPKRWGVALGIAVAASALPFVSRTATRADWPPSARWVAWTGMVLLSLVVIATLRAPALAAAIDQSRWMLLLVAGAVIAASPLLDGRARWVVAGAAAVAILVNALMSLTQAAGWGPAFTVAGTGGRYDTGALLGNEGYVALACALLAAAAAVVGWTARTSRVRWLGGLVVVIALATMLVNGQRTSLLAWALAMLVVVLARTHANLLRGMTLAVAVFGAGALIALATVWRPTADAAPIAAARMVALERVTTYRVGAWAAAVHMIETRPGFGHGPGSFATQSQSHRLAVESAWRQRLNVPPTATTFTQAHQDYLQFAAECGVPALLAALVLMLALGRGLLQVATRASGLESQRAEALLLLAVLTTGAFSALAWFPLQIPLTALVLMLAAGRAWRLIVLAEPVR